MVNTLVKAWNMYTGHERRNIAIYIAGIMFYKFGLESFNGSITSLATDRYSALGYSTFTRVGVLSGLNQATQCIGSILIAPLIKMYATRSVLSFAVFAFGLLSLILIICDAASGGKIKSGGKVHYGSYHPDAIFPIYIFSGVSYGMVELIRRVIPRDIVGGHVDKLKRMDAMVHIFYEVAGTVGAFASAIFIKKLGNNYSFIVTPICFTIAGIIWKFIDADFSPAAEKNKDLAEEVGGDFEAGGGYLAALVAGFKGFGHSVYLGSKIVFGNRKFIWLVPGYSLALFGHRYLENNLANIYAKQVLGDSSFQQIIVGGSNLGELFGAATVFFTARLIPTPIPFIRLDSLLLLIVWYLPFFVAKAKPHDSSVAWRMAGTFIPISFGWAAGDVSLAAYIQSSLARVESTTKGISALGAVMSFLYVTYISLYAILSPCLGIYVDRHKNQMKQVFTNIGGVHFTILAVIIFTASLVPRGALSLNPRLLDNERLDSDLEAPVSFDKAEKAPSENSDDPKADEKAHVQMAQT